MKLDIAPLQDIYSEALQNSRVEPVCQHNEAPRREQQESGSDTSLVSSCTQLYMAG